MKNFPISDRLQEAIRNLAIIAMEENYRILKGIQLVKGYHGLRDQDSLYDEIELYVDTGIVKIMLEY
jgi:hypothetical protein